MNKQVDDTEVTTELEADLEPVTTDEEGEELAPEADDDTEANDDEGGEVVVSIEGVTPTPDEEKRDADPWIKEVRKQNREQSKIIKKLQREAKEARAANEPKLEPLGDKPTLESVSYDTEAYEGELAKWFDKKRAQDEQATKAETDTKKAKDEWDAQLSGYRESAVNLGVPDYEDAEEAVRDILSPQQQGMIVQGSEKSAQLIYALGKNPELAKELAQISDPVKFVFAVARLEGKVSMSKRTPSSAPEKKLTGQGRTSGTVDSTLEKLRSDAEKTGDMSKVFAYKRKKSA